MKSKVFINFDKATLNVVKRHGKGDEKSSNATEDCFLKHKCRYNLLCLSGKGLSSVFRYIKVSLQDIFIAFAMPLLVSFRNWLANQCVTQKYYVMRYS